MDWLERLNRGVGRLDVGKGAIEVLAWAYSPALPDNMPHRHTFFEVCIVGNRGAGKFIVGNDAARLESGTIFFARPGIVHQIVNTGHVSMELNWVSFRWIPPHDNGPDDLSRLMDTFRDSAILSISDSEGKLTSLWSALRIVAGGKEHLGLDAQISALTITLVLSIAQCGSGTEADAPVKSDRTSHSARLAVQYIHDNLARPLSAREIADQVYLSPRHLARVFRRSTGKTPLEYIQHARLESAASMLVSSALPIKEIAVTVGYADVHYFTRIFTRQFTIPPGEYRSTAMKSQKHTDITIEN